MNRSFHASTLACRLRMHAHHATAALLFLVGTALVASSAGAQTFPPLPICSYCPVIADGGVCQVV